MKDDAVQKYILTLVGKIVHSEVKKLCSESVQSVLLSSDPRTLQSFTWQDLKSELSIHAPVLKGILESTGVESRNRPNFDAVVCLCIALLAKNRNPKMSLIAKIFSLILYAGHSSKEVLLFTHNYYWLLIHILFSQLFQTFTRLQRLNVSVSYPSLIRLLDKVGATYDEKTKKWFY